MNGSIPVSFAGLRLWNGPAPLSADGDADRVEHFEEERDGILRLTDVSVPTIDFFPAVRHDNSPRPAVLVCPGGGYSILAWNHEGINVAYWLAHCGFSAFLLKYRCPDRRDAALADAARAIRIIRANAEKWRIDAGKIGILGFSAGAHLAARLCTMPDGARPYDDIDETDREPFLPDFQMPIYPAYIYREGYACDPDFKITKATPPAFIAQSADDPFGDSSFAYAIALRKAGVPVELHIFPRGSHGYGLLRQGTAPGAELAAAAERWLRQFDGDA